MDALMVVPPFGRPLRQFALVSEAQAVLYEARFNEEMNYTTALDVPDQRGACRTVVEP